MRTYVEHIYYNRRNFPTFVGSRGNWDIYANAVGYCAAIPTKEAALRGCKASHFGDLNHVRVTLGMTLGTGITLTSPA